MSGVSQSSALLQRTTARTIEVLTSTTVNTKAVLNTISDSQWWKDSISYLRPLHVRLKLGPLRVRLKKAINVEISQTSPKCLMRVLCLFSGSRVRFAPQSGWIGQSERRAGEARLQLVLRGAVHRSIYQPG